MAGSNEDWGYLAEHDDELAEVWDGYARLPEPGENKVLDSFCEDKRISIAALVRLGARLSDNTVLAFPYPGGLKYRDMVTGRRWAYTGSEFKALKIVRANPDAATDTVIVCEGETDAARLSEGYDVDVAVLPAGALRFTPEFAEQLYPYRLVLVGLDDDEAGEAGSKKIMEAVGQAVRFKPPANDWCETEELPELPDPSEAPQRLDVLVPAQQLLALEVPEQPSWFEHDLLPIGGQLILHGALKSFKSFLGLDMLAALAQGSDWCCFEPMEEPAKVAVIQFEIPWAYYRQRVHLLRAHATEPDEFDRNFFTYSPLRRPELVAGNRAHEDRILAQLLDADIQVVLVDPIRRATGAIDMNAEGDVRKILGFFERLQDAGLTVVATHHDNKEGMKSRGGDPIAMTGSGAFGGDADTIVSVEIPRGEDLRSPRRNLHFLLRNAPTVGPRGMEMREDGSILYSPDPWDAWLDDDGADDTGNESPPI